METSSSPFRRVLITGGTGFIGTHLVRRLMMSHVPIQLLSRSKNKAERIFGKDVSIIEGDFCNQEDALKAIKDCDAVIHLGGLYRFGQRHAKELRRINVLGTQNMIHAAKKAGVLKFVFIGTAGVLRSHHKLIQEKDFPAKAPWGTPYKTTKWKAESLVLEAIKHGLPACIASPTCPIGEGDDNPTPTGRMVLDFLKGQFPFYSHTGINVIDVHDLVEGILAALIKGQIGERYLLAGENLWLKDFLDRLSVLTGLKSPDHSIPWPVILAAGATSELSTWIKRSESRLNLETALHARRVQFYNAQKTYQALKWKPCGDSTPALARAIQWYKKEKPSSVLPTSSKTTPEPAF